MTWSGKMQLAGDCPLFLAAVKEREPRSAIRQPASRAGHQGGTPGHRQLASCRVMQGFSRVRGAAGLRSARWASRLVCAKLLPYLQQPSDRLFASYTEISTVS